MSTLVILGLPGEAIDQYRDRQEADSSSMTSVQSAWCGGGGSARCIACPSLASRQEWPQTPLLRRIAELRAWEVKLALHKLEKNRQLMKARASTP